MPKLERYVTVGQKRLRLGYTTGSCAAAAARAAAELLLANHELAAVELETPAGIKVIIDIEQVQRGPSWVECAVRKDGGDDADVTDGALVCARVSKTDAVGISIDGGFGVGRVTRAGLDQPPGAAAINRVPREMIETQVQDAARTAGYDGGLLVVISVPEGERLAEKTFNPRLGIEGGISILGTSGIVRPMSEDALIASIHLEMDMRKAAGVRNLLVTPGNYGHDFALSELGLDLDTSVQCSNFVGNTIDYAVSLGFESLLLVGHIGKLVKVAAGIMNTHSKVADARRETMAAHAALAGAPSAVIRAIMESVTTDEAIAVLDEANMRATVMASITSSLDCQLKHRAGSQMRIEAVFFSREHGLLGETPGARELVSLHVRD